MVRLQCPRAATMAAPNTATYRCASCLTAGLVFTSSSLSVDEASLSVSPVAKKRDILPCAN